MRLSQPIRDNLQFLLAETSTQLNSLVDLLANPSADLTQRMLDRRGYSYNLKMRIHDACANELRMTDSAADLETYSLRAAESIATQLDRLTALINDCARQLSGRKRRGILRTLSSTGLLEDVQKGIELIRFGIEEDGTKTALKVSDLANLMSTKHSSFFEGQSRELESIEHPDRVLCAFFIATQLNEMSAVLREVSESLVGARLGRPLQMDRYRLLQTACDDLGIDEATVAKAAETNSGTNISRIGCGTGEGFDAIIKDGAKGKLKEEQRSVKNWHEIYPGLAPQILSFRKRGQNASLAIEHLPGVTFDQMLISGTSEQLRSNLQHLAKTLRSVWRETKSDEQVPSFHMAQLRKRLDSVLEIHPEFGRGGGRIGRTKIHSLLDLIEMAEEKEVSITPPFSVYIHGDFNLDNIIFDPATERINFIDLHRSRYSDYTQDVSVFMVSGYRLQALDKQTRRRVADVAEYVHAKAQKFARQQGDRTFEMRLAYGLARSFITSTRFILDKSLAKAMCQRGCYILQRTIDQPVESAADFRLPIRELFS
ncbi:Phosphotransferase enzyme family protein [Rubripirellula lacrimiformis]|uniref:Phosphotransferase enzyme family protein n=1 Tax=Rubripirellula lacrimiformis TaxID=1930273 RepID=A0A517NA48_9BACT|nr:phosphotransferase [Rubripirellula lacrimiformis]QDT04006.1 Phosphotransferase enzyme family protein [Rubripirellula lacrimiformis]